MALRILIADDHKAIRQGLEQILLDEYPHAKIGLAENGEILVRKATTAEWDIVITDVSMPIMNGLDALREIRRLVPWLPVLILSIHDESHHMASAFRYGASGFLSKTSAQDELASAVSTILSGKEYR
jgi:two-component system invasion response regulator UvrY